MQNNIINFLIYAYTILEGYMNSILDNEVQGREGRR